MKTPISLMLAICAAAFPVLTSTAATVQVRVGAGGLKFTPSTVTINPGDTVQWTWSASGHSSTSGTPGNPNGLWDSGVQNSGFTFSHTFSGSGTFPYYCLPHGVCCGMVGSVIVSSTTQQAGAIFVNGNTPTNAVFMYTRGTDGQLTSVGSFPTQGSGSGSGLASQGSVALTKDHSFLYVANALSNDISAFAVGSSGLTFINKVPSGGTFPNSVAVFGNLVYVLNSKGTAANISGFNIQSDGSLVALPGSTRRLSSARPKPAQVGFTPDGSTLIVSEKGPDDFGVYAVGPDGLATGPTAQASVGAGPFGFAFDGAGYLIVSEVQRSSASSYTVTGGLLQVVTAGLRDFGKAACWIACTNSSAPQQFSYISNTSSDSISGFADAPDGHISLLDANGRTALLPAGAFPLDLVVSSDNQYLYVLEGHLPGVAAFQIQSNGSLVQIQDLRGTPRSSYGLTGY